MAIAFDNLSSGTVTSGTSIPSVSHTATGSNLIAIASLNTNAAVTSVSITYGGVAMSLINNAGASRQAYLYYLINPPQGSSTVAASWVTSVNAGLICRTYTGVDTVNPLGTSAVAAATSTTASVTVTSNVGQLVVDAMCCALTPAAAVGQTQEYNTIGVFDGGSRKDGATSVTMSWTFSSGVWSIVAVPLLPNTRTGNPVSFSPYMMI